MRRITTFLTATLLFLAACSPAIPQDGTLSVPEIQTADPEQLNVFATQTQSAAQAATAEAQQAQIRTPPALGSPSPLPALTPILESAGPFRQVSRQEALILGKTLALLPVEGGFLLFSEGGISYLANDQWTGYFTQDVGIPVGVDAAMRAWAVAADGRRIYRSDAPVTVHREPSDDIYTWTSFGLDEGWTPVTSTIGSPVRFGLVSGSRGDLWLTTQQDVRALDTTWRVYDSSAMGMPLPTGESTSDFYLFPLLSSGEIYAGRCDWSPTGPAGGGGWHVFDGANWFELAPELSSGCANAFAQDASGRVWLAQDASLWRYNPESGDLEQVALPEPPQPYRFGYFTALNVAADSSLWAQIALCSEVDCFSGEALYRLKDGAWQMIGDPSPAAGQKLLFDKRNTPWLISAGSIYQIVDDSLQPVPGLLVQAAASDDAGDLWLLAQASGPPTIWELTP